MVITKKQLISRIDNVLKIHQFRRDGSLWNRNYADFVDVIDLQISKSKDMFTINFGVADKFVAYACWGLDSTGMIDEPSCTVRARLSELLYGRDIWWKLSDSDGIEKALSGIQDVAVPFIQLNHNIDHMIASIENDPAANRYPPGIIYLALLYYRNGDSGRCREIFKSMRLTGAWSKKASDILNALN